MFRWLWILVFMAFSLYYCMLRIMLVVLYIMASLWYGWGAPQQMIWYDDIVAGVQQWECRRNELNKLRVYKCRTGAGDNNVTNTNNTSSSTSSTTTDSPQSNATAPGRRCSCPAANRRTPLMLGDEERSLDALEMQRQMDFLQHHVNRRQYTRLPSLHWTHVGLCPKFLVFKKKILSTRNVRDASADRRKILHGGQNLDEFYNVCPKFRWAHPQKN